MGSTYTSRIARQWATPDGYAFEHVDGVVEVPVYDLGKAHKYVPWQQYPFDLYADSTVDEGRIWYYHSYKEPYGANSGLEFPIPVIVRVDSVHPFEKKAYGGQKGVRFRIRCSGQFHWIEISKNGIVYLEAHEDWERMRAEEVLVGEKCRCHETYLLWYLSLAGLVGPNVLPVAARGLRNALVKMDTREVA
jgi:hypothetical protein